MFDRFTDEAERAMLFIRKPGPAVCVELEELDLAADLREVGETLEQAE